MPQRDDLVPLPTFFNGIPLSAHDLNRIGSVQEYIYWSNQRWNPGFLRWENGDDGRWMHHTHQYLHYSVSGQVDLTINGTAHGTIGPGNSYIDLDSDGANPYGLTINTNYELTLTSGSGYVLILYEWAENARDLDPGSVASAGVYTDSAVITAATLNNTVARNQYFLDNYTFNPISPFHTWRAGGSGGPGTMHFTFRHTHDYIYVAGYTFPSDGNTYQFEVRWGDDYDGIGQTNGMLAFNDCTDQAGNQNVRFTMHMIDTPTGNNFWAWADNYTGDDPEDQKQFGGDFPAVRGPTVWPFNTSPPPAVPLTMPAKGELYTIGFRMDGQDDGDGRVLACCEVPLYKDYLVNGNFGLKEDT